MREPVWCLGWDEPLVSLAEWWHDDRPWVRLWSSYVVLPYGSWGSGRDDAA